MLFAEILLRLGFKGVQTLFGTESVKTAGVHLSVTLAWRDIFVAYRVGVLVSGGVLGSVAAVTAVRHMGATSKPHHHGEQHDEK
jgi:hypothetical protein